MIVKPLVSFDGLICASPVSHIKLHTYSWTRECIHTLHMHLSSVESIKKWRHCFISCSMISFFPIQSHIVNSVLPNGSLQHLSSKLLSLKSTIFITCTRLPFQWHLIMRHLKIHLFSSIISLQIFHILVSFKNSKSRWQRKPGIPVA